MSAGMVVLKSPKIHVSITIMRTLIKAVKSNLFRTLENAQRFATIPSALMKEMQLALAKMF